MPNQNLTGYPSNDLPQSKNATRKEKNPFIPSLDTITLLKLLSRKNRNCAAIDCNDLHATYQELIDDSHTLYLAFKKLGIKKGDIVTISLPSNYQAITSFLGLNELGAVTTFIDTYSSTEDVLKYLKKYHSPVFINFDKTAEENAYIKKNSAVNHIITLSKERTNSRDIYMPYKMGDLVDFHELGSIAKLEKERFHLPNKGSDNSLILYTSGSTGEPKAVVLTNKNVLAAQMYAGNTSHTENITGPKTMACVPIRYPYGMVTSLLTSLLWGKETIMAPDWDGDTVNYYYSKKPSIIFGSPAVLELTMRFLEKGQDLSQVSHFISGGDFLTEQHSSRGYAFFKEHNNTIVEIGNGCGNAETVSIGSTPVGVPLKQSTAGKILVGTTPLVIDANVPSDVPISNPEQLAEKRYYEVGELCLAGEYVFKEYMGEPDKTACAKFKRRGKTFFRTGTLGFIDEDGYFTPTDRKSRFYIRSTGHKVYLDHVQHAILKSDSRIADVAVVKVPDENELYVNKAFVVLCEDVVATVSLQEEIFQKLATDESLGLKEYELPRYIEFIRELPRNAGTEKIDYSRLEEMAKDLV